jgi:hypothetical protein
MNYNKFYFSVAKDVTQMTDEELEQELSSAMTTEQTAQIYQQGISTKESVRTRLARAEKFRRDEGISSIGTDEKLLKIISSTLFASKDDK